MLKELLGLKPAQPKYKTHVVFVLDSSGSMASCRDATIRGFNEQVDIVRKKAGSDHEVKASLVTFCESVTTKFWAADISTLKPIDADSYCPNGGTALFDGLGLTLRRLLAEDSDKTVSYLVVSLSDGEENSSQHFNSETLKSLKEECEKTGRFTFAFMGANMDLGQFQAQAGYSRSAIRSYTSTPVGTAQVFNVCSAGVANYLSERALGNVAMSNFWKGADDAADAVTMTSTGNPGPDAVTFTSSGNTDPAAPPIV